MSQGDAQFALSERHLEIRAVLGFVNIHPAGRGSRYGFVAAPP